MKKENLFLASCGERFGMVIGVCGEKHFRFVWADGNTWTRQLVLRTAVQPVTEKEDRKKALASAMRFFELETKSLNSFKGLKCHKTKIDSMLAECQKAAAVASTL